MKSGIQKITQIASFAMLSCIGTAALAQNPVRELSESIDPVSAAVITGTNTAGLNTKIDELKPIAGLKVGIRFEDLPADLQKGIKKQMTDPWSPTHDHEADRNGEINFRCQFQGDPGDTWASLHVVRGYINIKHNLITSIEVYVDAKGNELGFLVQAITEKYGTRNPKALLPTWIGQEICLELNQPSYFHDEFLATVSSLTALRKCDEIDKKNSKDAQEKTAKEAKKAANDL